MRPLTLSLLMLSIFLPVSAVSQTAKNKSKTTPNAKRQTPKSQSKTDNQKSKISPLDPLLKDAIRTAPDSKDLPGNSYTRLLDLGKVSINSDGRVVAEYRETFKLFNENARHLAEVSLPYNASYQYVKVLKARTIKKDGTIVEVKPEDMRITAPYGEYLMYSDAQNIGFSLPAIEDDCIIDYTYQMITEPLLMPGEFWTYWAFNGVEPVSLCRYTVTAPADKPLKYKLYNDDKLTPTITTSADGKTKTYFWEMKNIKQIEPEPAMPPTKDIRIYMEATSIPDWNSIAQWYWNLSKPQYQATDAIRKTVTELTKGKTNDSDKTRAIYDWVANKVRYVGLEFGISAYKPHAAAEVHDKRYGDCKDKATLLITMLGLAGIKAHPVLIKAGDTNPVDTGLPSLNAFNHCIALAEVEGKELWLDATAETVGIGDIPQADRGAQGFVIREGKGQFLTVPHYQADENGTVMNSTVEIKPDGSAAATTELTMVGSAAQGIRAAVRAVPPDKRKEMMEGLMQSFATGGSLKEFSVSDPFAKDGAFRMKITYDAPNYAQKTGSLLIIPLNPANGGSKQRNPFTKENRQYPIVETENGIQQSTVTLRLPESYTLEDLPENLELDCGVQSYKRTIKPSDNTFTFTETLIKKIGTLPPADGIKLRTYYDNVLRAASDQIVLKKKK
jgi:transglutaminase-like putative cysteine protease